MKIYKDGKLVERVSRNDLKNTFSPKHHRPYMRPGYKGKYLAQVKTNKGLLIAIGILLALLFALCLGFDLRVKSLKKEQAQVQKQLDTGLTVIDGYLEYVQQLESELASCSAKLEEKKLSYKATIHSKQQPVVAEKIKYVFGNEWAEATELFSRESSLNPLAINPSSKACGLVQALPCSKLVNTCSLSDIDCQLNWGKNYIKSRYGSASRALAFHDQKGWY